MRYINPKTDFAFKKIFGSTGSQGILRSFLNAVLYNAEPRIASLEIVDPYSIPRLEGMKDSYLDVRAVLDDGQRVIIEMQVLNVPGMEKRVLYNAAKEYSNQLIKGQDYKLLNPVIALTITDFVMFPELPGQVISRFALMEKSGLIAYPEGDVELVFVELPKFNRALEELSGLTEEWLYFVDNAAELESVPTQLRSVPEIEDAFERAESAKLTPEEDNALERKNRWVADQRMFLAMKLNAEARADESEEKARAAEENAREAEENAREAEEKLKTAEEHAREADEKLKTAEEHARKIEEKARVAEEYARAAEEKVKAAEDQTREAAEKVKAAEERGLGMQALADRILGGAVKGMLAQGMPEQSVADALGVTLEQVKAAQRS